MTTNDNGTNDAASRQRDREMAQALDRREATRSELARRGYSAIKLERNSFERIEFRYRAGDAIPRPE